MAGRKKPASKSQPASGVCPRGHRYSKSSDCPVCPVCEKNKRRKDPFFIGCAAPVRRALESRQVTRVEKLAEFTQAEVLSWHGIGPASLPVFREALKKAGLRFKKLK